jgi:hypothetical protein
MKRRVIKHKNNSPSAATAATKQLFLRHSLP